jgi:hypothetical protein
MQQRVRKDGFFFPLKAFAFAQDSSYPIQLCCKAHSYGSPFGLIAIFLTQRYSVLLG